MELCLEVVAAVVAVIDPLFSGEPLLALPDMTLSLHGLDDRHPPVVADEDEKADDPLEKDPAEVINAEKNHP